jgi:hypothetical protein
MNYAQMYVCWSETIYFASLHTQEQRKHMVFILDCVYVSQVALPMT